MFQELFWEYIKVFGNLQASFNKLVILILLLYGVVATVGPLWTYSLDENYWDPPPEFLLPVLSLLKRIFLRSENKLAKSIAVARSQINGPFAIIMGFWGMFFLFILKAGNLLPIPVIAGMDKGNIYTVVWAIAAVFCFAVLVLISRGVIRAMLCLECLSLIGEPNNSGTQEETYCGQQNMQEQKEEANKYFGQLYGVPNLSVNKDTPGFPAIRTRTEKVIWQQKSSSSGESGEKEFYGICGRHIFCVQKTDKRKNHCSCYTAEIKNNPADSIMRDGNAFVEICDKACKKGEKAYDTKELNRNNTISSYLNTAVVCEGSQLLPTKVGSMQAIAHRFPF